MAYSEARHEFDPVISPCQPFMPTTEKFVRVAERYREKCLLLTTIDSYVPPRLLRANQPGQPPATPPRLPRPNQPAQPLMVPTDAPPLPTPPVPSTSGPDPHPDVPGSRYSDPPTLKEITEYFREKFVDTNHKCARVSVFRSFLDVGEDHVAEVERKTRGQAGNPDWKKYRQYTMSSSDFGKFCSRWRSQLKSKTLLDMDGVLDRVFGVGKDISFVKSIKYGRLYEKSGFAHFQKAHEAEHEASSVVESGIWLCPEDISLGSSPDGMVYCSCHEKSTLEIKCPLTCEKEIPSLKTVKYLTFENGQYGLKKTDGYFYQVQGQMAITKSKLCHFVVYSPLDDGIHSIIIDIPFDEDFWNTARGQLSAFFDNIAGPALLFGKDSLAVRAKNAGLTVSPAKRLPTPRQPKQTTPSTSQKKIVEKKKIYVQKGPAIPTKTVDKGKGKQPVQRRFAPTTTPAALPTVEEEDDDYPCPVCGENCIYDADTFEQSNVACDWCDNWFHYGCVHITHAEARDLQINRWYCPGCLPMVNRMPKL